MNLHSIKGLVMWYMHLPFRIKKYQRNNERNLARIRQKDKITVVFFASNLSMWRYQGLYEEMQKYPRYETHIVLSPLKCFSIKEVESGFEGLRDYFSKKGMAYHDFDIKANVGYEVNNLNPDLMFYVQPYYTICTYKPHRYQNFNDALLGYYPYGLFMSDKSDFAEDMHNRAWKLFYPSKMHKELAKKYAAIGDKNVIVTGYPNADQYLTNEYQDVWKPQETAKKRIIWAPHFTIYDDGWMNATMFIDIADFMLEIADKYKDTLQMAFKPHPRLLSELYGHPKWGKEKADAYYKKWEERENCQLEKGDFVNLFRGSDAMVHDSGSFMIEYLYTNKPVQYTSYCLDKLREKMSDFDIMALDAHYEAICKEDIERFITETVFDGIDPMAKKRSAFVNEYLLPPYGKTVAQMTMEDINNSLSKI